MKRFSAYDPNKFHAMIKSNKEKLNEIKDESNRQKPVEIDNPKKVARLLPSKEEGKDGPVTAALKLLESHGFVVLCPEDARTISDLEAEIEPLKEGKTLHKRKPRANGVS